GAGARRGGGARRFLRAVRPFPAGHPGGHPHPRAAAGGRSADHPLPDADRRAARGGGRGGHPRPHREPGGGRGEGAAVMKTGTTESALRDLLAARLAARLGLDPAELDLRERFSRYGLDSAGAMGLVAELSAELGRELSPTLVWAHPSVGELARHLAGTGETHAPALRTARPADEPIAIVGVACRFPGAPDWRAFWRMLCDGVDATATVPPDRWDADAWYDPDPQAPGKINTRRGAFLDRVDLFDPLFFGISPREACEMDPKQRLMLELCWEALEDAGIPPRSLGGNQSGERAGVFAGVIGHDYAELHRLAGATITSHTGPGNTLSIVANRVSYLLGLRGPSLCVDTACSSSLVAVHLACRSLRDGECSVALAGG